MTRLQGEALNFTRIFLFLATAFQVLDLNVLEPTMIKQQQSTHYKIPRIFWS